jgi:lipopolysaccharide export system permease protein
VHVNALRRDNSLQGVTLYEFDEDKQLIRSGYAGSARFGESGWQLFDLQETRFQADNTRVVNHEQQAWEISLDPELLAVVATDPDKLSIRGLYSYMNYMREQGLDADRYELAFWNKVLQPLAMVALVLISISFVFGPLRSVTMGQRVFAGTLVGLAFKFSQELLGPASSVYGFMPIISALVPILICFIIGGWLLRRAG